MITIAINGNAGLYNHVAKRNGLRSSVLLDPGYRALNTFRVTAVPTTFVLDGRGMIARRFIGGHDKADFTRALDDLK